MPLDVRSLIDHVRSVRSSTQSAGPRTPAPTAPRIDAARARWWRVTASHAARRIAACDLVEAARGGLQDSAPKAAQLALHARVDDVDVEAWSHDDLVQLWLRWAAYVVPRSDVAVFSRGSMPRDLRQAAALDALGDAVVDVIGDEPTDTPKVVARMPDLTIENLIRSCCRSGRVLIRWDTHTTQLMARQGAPDVIDDAEARRELLRRFLHWMGPADEKDFARWAGIAVKDAVLTWSEMESELTPVALDGRRRFVLGADVEALTTVERPHGVRLLPMGDPVSFMVDGDIVVPPPLDVDPRAGVTSRVVNGLTGRVIIDGDPVGAWGRAGQHLTIDPWIGLSLRRRNDVDAAADAMGRALGREVDVRWLTR